MNRECWGDYFTANEKRWYRCFRDGAILLAPADLETCPNCQRPVEGQDRGEVRCRTEVRVLVTLEIHEGEPHEYELPALSGEGAQ